MVKVQAKGRESMDETKQKEPVYSSESTETTTLGTPPETTKPTEPSGTEETGQSSKQTQTTQMAALPEVTRTVGYSSLAEFSEFLKRTRRVWLIVAGAIFGLIAVVTLVKRVSDWAKNARERRHEQAVATVTPDILTARCGKPEEDVTRDVYPILLRTMNYQPKGDEKLVLAFSRTAEEKSDWVFLSMKEQSGARSYDTTEAKIAALPCLDSKK
jgi:hypothetical protein